VGIGQQEAVVREHDRRTCAGRDGPIAATAGHLQRSDPWGQLFGDRDDNPGVRVERIDIGFG
jgi:hypothetical protein